MSSEALKCRLDAIEQKRGISGRTIYVWRDEDEAIYQQNLVEAQSRCGPNDEIHVIGWNVKDR
ncbi:MAG TPA: hypothetical protein VIH18_20325 [Candidatus Binatia bacterium]|jgi:hypothetical protein